MSVDNTKYTTNKKQTYTLLAGFELAISASKRPKIHAIDRAANGICRISWIWKNNIKMGRRKVVKMGDERVGFGSLPVVMLLLVVSNL